MRESEVVRGVALADVGVDHEHAFVLFREEQREIAGEQRLAFVRRGAGDHDDVRGILLRAGILKVGEEDLEVLVEAVEVVRGLVVQGHVHLLVVAVGFAAFQADHGAEQRDLEFLCDLVGGGDVVAQHGVEREETEEERRGEDERHAGLEDRAVAHGTFLRQGRVDVFELGDAELVLDDVEEDFIGHGGGRHRHFFRGGEERAVDEVSLAAQRDLTAVGDLLEREFGVLQAELVFHEILHGTAVHEFLIVVQHLVRHYEVGVDGVCAPDGVIH